MRRFLFLIAAAGALSGCLAGAAIGAVGAVAGVAVKTTGAVVGGAVDLVTPRDDKDDEKEKSTRGS